MASKQQEAKERQGYETKPILPVCVNMEDHIKIHDGYIYGELPMFGKLASAIARKQHEAAMEHICEIAGCAIDFAWEHDFDISDCVEHAWSQIKSRKGKIIDGVFVKDGD